MDGTTLIVSMILLIAVAFVVVVWAMASRYKKIRPTRWASSTAASTPAPAPTEDPASWLPGRCRRGSLLWPVIEHFQPMSTAVSQVEIDERDIPNKDNVKISAKGVGTYKIETTQESLHNAAAAFLGKSDDELARIVKNILQGHLRSIIVS